MTMFGKTVAESLPKKWTPELAAATKEYALMQRRNAVLEEICDSIDIGKELHKYLVHNKYLHFGHTLENMLNKNIK